MKEIEDYPGYLINEEGEVFTTKRGFKKMTPNVSLKYWAVKLYHEGKVKHCFIHRLLAKAFIPKPEDKDYVNHKDGNKLNNSLDNLEWVTFSENIIHSFETGLNTPHIGEDNGRALLNEDQVREIFIRLQKGERSVDLAKEFKVEKSTIGNIKRKRLWTHITSDMGDVYVEKRSNKASEDVIHSICRMLELGERPTPIAIKLNVSVDLVYDVKRRKSFKDIVSLYQW